MAFILSIKSQVYREGVAYSNDKNTELLFVTLNKSEKAFSQTNLYKDFAISETIFLNGKPKMPLAQIREKGRNTLFIRKRDG